MAEPAFREGWSDPAHSLEAIRQYRCDMEIGAAVAACTTTTQSIAALMETTAQALLLKYKYTAPSPALFRACLERLEARGHVVIDEGNVSRGLAFSSPS
jgi:hypothetical protein